MWSPKTGPWIWVLFIGRADEAGAFPQGGAFGRGQYSALFPRGCFPSDFLNIQRNHLLFQGIDRGRMYASRAAPPCVSDPYDFMAIGVD